jgi:membrane fusion protein, adhesin transport system
MNGVERVAPASSRVPHLALWLCALAMTAFFVWAAIFKLDIISVADGQVVPSSRVQIVQHLEGGIVREILVREGERVAADQPVVILEQTISGAGVEELQSRVTALRVEIASLEAQAAKRAEPTFDDEMRSAHPDLVEQANSLFRATLASHRNEVEAQRELISQREHALNEISARIRNARDNLKLVDEQVALSAELLRDSLTTQHKHLAYLRDQGELRSRIEEDQSALAGARSALSEARVKLEKIDSAFQENVESRLRDARQLLDESTQRLRRLADSLNRTVIRSPVEGVVKTLHVTTLGGVLGPGQSVAEIVPSEDRLIIEAKLSITDIGYVKVGQSAAVRLMGRESSVYGKIDGSVIHVAPDSSVAQDGRVYYLVRVETLQDRFSSGDATYQLFPGMAVMTHIHTGKRTVLQYIIEPFAARFTGALQER